MIISAGREVYAVDANPVKARGAIYSEEELTEALSGRVSGILWDEAGRANLATLLASIADTEFEKEAVERILSGSPEIHDWRVGEAIAEVLLVDHRHCEFPWPTGRDLKNPKASAAGTDLVGFQLVEKGICRFAFGEVKTSEQEQWPPSVMKGRHGLAGQIEGLRDSIQVKDNLVKYLGHHACNAPWEPQYRCASSRYLANPTDVSIFGVMVRDVEPKAEDLSGRAQSLAAGCPAATFIELRAMYFPSDSIGTLSQRAMQTRKGNHDGNPRRPQSH